MAFVYKNSIGNNARKLMTFTITGSQVISVGEAVKFSSGLLVTAGAGGDFLGVVVGLTKLDGSPQTTNGAGGAFTGTYTVAATTDCKAIVDVSEESIYSVAADATLGTTTGSNLAGYNMDMTAGSQTLSEATSATTTAQWFSWGPDPDPKAPSNSVLVSIFEHQITGPVVS